MLPSRKTLEPLARNPENSSLVTAPANAKVGVAIKPSSWSKSASESAFRHGRANRDRYRGFCGPNRYPFAPFPGSGRRFSVFERSAPFRRTAATPFRDRLAERTGHHALREPPVDEFLPPVEAEGIEEVNGILEDVAIQIDVGSRKSNRILTRPPPCLSIVIPGPEARQLRVLVVEPTSESKRLELRSIGANVRGKGQGARGGGRGVQCSLVPGVSPRGDSLQRHLLFKYGMDLSEEWEKVNSK